MERYADDLASALRAHTSDVEASETSFAVGALTDRRDPLRRHWLRYWSYPRYAGTFHPDVFHILDHGYGDLLRHLTPNRTIVTCHDLMLLRAHEGGSGTFSIHASTYWRFKWSVGFLARAARIICPSAATRDDVLRFLSIPSERVVVIPLGIGSRFRPAGFDTRRAARKTLGVRNEDRVLLHVSTGHPYKNNAGVLHTLARLRRRESRWTLIRAGRTMSPEEHEVARSIGILDSVLDLGSVTDERLIELYAGADVLLFPSFAEGFGWPVLEALSSGLPVVASSSAPSLREIAADAALYAAPDDIGGLADHIRSIAASPSLRGGLVARGLERSREFSWRAIARKYSAIYAEIAEQSERRRRQPDPGQRAN